MFGQKLHVKHLWNSQKRFLMVLLDSFKWVRQIVIPILYAWVSSESGNIYA